MLALDTETTLSSDAEPVPRVVCASLAWGPGPDERELIHQSDPDAPGILADALSGPVALANAPFDMTVISEKWPELEPLCWAALERQPGLGMHSGGDIRDVCTRERLLDLARGKGLKRRYSLADVAERRAGITLDKSKDTWRKRYAELEHVPLAWWPSDAKQYALDD